MPLDTGPMLEALDPPVFRHEGQEFRGRHLSILEWIRYLGRLETLGKKKLGLLATQVFYRELANAWFPEPRARPWWKVWAPRVTTVGDIVLTLPPAVQDQVMATFIRSQHRAMGVPGVGSTKTAPTTE